MRKREIYTNMYTRAVFDLVLHINLYLCVSEWKKSHNKTRTIPLVQNKCQVGWSRILSATDRYRYIFPPPPPPPLTPSPYVWRLLTRLFVGDKRQLQTTPGDPKLEGGRGCEFRWKAANFPKTDLFSEQNCGGGGHFGMFWNTLNGEKYIHAAFNLYELLY